METSTQRTGLAQILLLVVWIPAISFAVGVHKQAHVSIPLMRFHYSQGQEIDRVLLYRIPKEGVTSGAIWAEVRNSVLQKNSWLPKKNSKQRTTLNEYNRLPTTRDTVRHEKLLRVRHINRDLPRSFSLGLQDKYVLTLTSRTIFRKVQSSLKNACQRFA